MTLPQANGLCENCLEANLRTVTVGRGALIISHCRHNQAGAVMPFRDDKPTGLWQIFTPVSAEEFSDSLGLANDISSTMKIKNFKGVC